MVFPLTGQNLCGVAVRAHMEIYNVNLGPHGHQANNSVVVWEQYWMFQII